jgi:16S rRNA processing protein RimM
MKDDRKICVGVISGAHGVRGLVRLRSFTAEPEAIFSYKPLADEDGKIFKPKLKSAAKDFFIASLDGVEDRDAAEALRNMKLYVTRNALPKPKKREYYERDLLGLMACDASGKDYGTVQAVHNYGGGPFLEIGTTKKNGFMLPFTDACVPEIDVDAGRVTIAVPEGWLEAAKPEKGREEADA